MGESGRNGDVGLPTRAGPGVVTCGFAGKRGRACGRLSAGLSVGMWAWSTAVLSLRDRG